MKLIKNKKIAIIGEGHEWSALPVSRELSKNNTLIAFLSESKSPSSYFSKFSKVVNIPPPSDKLFLKVLLYKLYKCKINCIICLNEEMKYFIVSNKFLFKNFKSCLPNFESYKIALNKNTSIRFAEKSGIPIPKIYDRNDRKKLLDLFPTTIVVKGDRGVSSLNVQYVDSMEQLDAAYEMITEIEESSTTVSSPPIIQQYVGGPTYLSQALCYNGKVKSVVSHIKIREWPITGGVTCMAKTIINQKLTDYTKKILEDLEWHGEAGIEWKYSKEKDEFYFVEINPRFEGSLDLTIKAGLNYPKILLCMIYDDESSVTSMYKKNVYYRWFFRLDFKHFLNKNYGISKLIAESLNPKINGELSLDNVSVLKIMIKMFINTLIKYINNDK